MAAMQRFLLLTLTLLVAAACASPAVISVFKANSPDAAASFRHHYKRVRSQTACSQPQPRVVRMQDVLPDPSKKYVPECTVLHVCARDTGCCHAEKVCGPLTQEEVRLHFHVFDGVRHVTEAVTFANHTSCACQNANELPR